MLNGPYTDGGRGAKGSWVLGVRIGNKCTKVSLLYIAGGGVLVSLYVFLSENKWFISPNFSFLYLVNLISINCCLYVLQIKSTNMNVIEVGT